MTITFSPGEACSAGNHFHTTVTVNGVETEVAVALDAILEPFTDREREKFSELVLKYVALNATDKRSLQVRDGLSALTIRGIP